MVNGKPVAFAIIPRCGGAALDETTFTASHELDEATTDPYPNNGAAFRGFRDEDVAWEIFLQHQDEVGDACEFFDDSQLAPGDSSAALAKYTVQRQWSNASGAAGHDPCVPEFSNEVYFNVMPLGTEDIPVSLDNSLVVAKGFKVKAGEKRQIPLGFYSAGATAPWAIKAVNAGLAGGPLGNDITLSLDVTSGQNGQKAYLTVAVQDRQRDELRARHDHLGEKRRHALHAVLDRQLIALRFSSSERAGAEVRRAYRRHVRLAAAVALGGTVTELPLRTGAHLLARRSGPVVAASVGVRATDEPRGAVVRSVAFEVGRGAC
jgi:hypothetical protein